MTLQHPYFVFVYLYDSKIDNDYVTDKWIYITGDDGTVSGQTDSVSGQCAINVQDAASDGDILTISDNTFDYQFILDTSTPSIEFNTYQNATNYGDICMTNNDENNNDITLHIDNYVKKDVNLKTLG